jgi:DNA-binding HxlR family transcriptional regulator
VFQFGSDSPEMPVFKDRLRALEAKGMVVRAQYSEHPPRHEYYLTEAAAALGPVFSALREWGTQFVTS